MLLPLRRIVVGSVAAVSLTCVAALHLYILVVSLSRAVRAPSPDGTGLSTTHHVVDLATSAAYLVAVAACAVLVTRFVRVGRARLLASSRWLWAAATIGGVIAAVALGVESWAAAIDYDWSYEDYRLHGDVRALIMDFIGVYALSFPILAPVGLLWFERLET